MGNDYHYLDPENKYTDKNGLLRNLADIKDEKVLLAFESLKVTKRVEELIENPLKIQDCIENEAPDGSTTPISNASFWLN